MLHLQTELKKIQTRIIDLSILVGDAVDKSIKSFLEANKMLAEEVITNDKEIDLEEVLFEEECLKILALNQPVAKDLRLVVAYLKINNDLERIGDLAVGISRKGKFLSNAKNNNTKLKIDYKKICVGTQEMLKKSISTIKDMNPKKAKDILKADAKINKLKKTFKNELLKMMKEKPEKVDILLRHHGFIRSLERIADMCTNIAEDIIYINTGKIIRHNLDKDYLED